MRFSSQAVSVNGIRLHTIQTGPEDGPPVVLLHGFPEYWRAWEKQIDALAQAGYRTLAPDQRGYHLSDKPRGVNAYHLDRLAEDARALIQSTAHTQAALVGHDWGAVVAWHVATHHPEVVNRMVILNGPHPHVMTRSLLRDGEQRRRSAYILFFQVPWLPEFFLRKQGYRAMIRALRSTARPDAFPDDMLREYIVAWSQPGALTAMLNWYRASVRAGLWEALRLRSAPRVRVPTLILWGHRDHALGEALAWESQALCENGRVEILGEATHWIQHEEPDRVNEHILGFLEDDNLPAW